MLHSPKLGQLREEKIRKALVHGIVDTGASHLVLPGAVAAALGLPERMRAPVQYADNRTAIRVFVEEVEVRLLGRSSVFEAIVEPDCPEPLVGAMVLEQLDLVVNCKTQQLEPRDPRGVLAYI